MLSQKMLHERQNVFTPFTQRRQMTLPRSNAVIKITAKMKIELTVAGSKITIDPSGVKIDAPTITLNSQGPMTINGLPVKIN